MARKGTKKNVRPSGSAASDVDAAGSSAGQAGTGSDVAGAAAQQETALDVNQNEATVASILQGMNKSSDFVSVLQGNLAGYLTLGQQCVSNAVSLANFVNSHTAGIGSGEAHRSMRMGDQTGTIRISDLAEMLKAGWTPPEE